MTAAELRGTLQNVAVGALVTAGAVGIALVVVALYIKAQGGANGR